jgi:uncharacterized membrane protein
MSQKTQVQRAREIRRTHATPPSEVEVHAAGPLERLIVLSDGVFAIAMTLLVVELVLPNVAPGNSAELARGLLALGPKYLSFVVSFLVIASYWTAHQRIFRYIQRADDRLIWLNVLLLLCIAFQPFPTSVLGTYGDQALAVDFYAGTLTVTGGVVLALWLYATGGHRLISPDLSPRLVRHHLWRAASVPSVFLMSIAVAQVKPTAAEFSWLAIAVLVLVFRRIYRDAT